MKKNIVVSEKYHKLNAEQVREIRRMFYEPELSQSMIAREFGVSQTTINHIMTGRTWKGIE